MSGTGYMTVATSSASPEWPTPRWLVSQLAAEFGPFDTDPAANAANAKAPLFYTQDDDGLAQPWKGRVWLNPPYGRGIGAWMAKARAEVASGNAGRVVCLVPARLCEAARLCPAAGGGAHRKRCCHPKRDGRCRRRRDNPLGAAPGQS